jgi:uncharacterized SAM-binding protein YcdF (DUF218 family)
LPHQQITEQQRCDAEVLWRYHQLDHPLRACEAAIGLGSHDLGVATCAARLYLRGLFPVVVFTGSTSDTTRARFPRGEAVHYREHALALGVPESAVLVEPTATNTGANITKSRAVLAAAGYHPASLLLICKPYAQRRSYATIRKLWPEVDVVCASAPTGYRDYVATIGDEHLVISMMVGDLQRILEYPERGFTVPQEVPRAVEDAYRRLRHAGFDARRIPER